MADQNEGLSTIGQIAITVKNIDVATAFYRDKLKMKFLFAAPGLSFFDCAGVRIMLSFAEKPEFDHAASILYFKVDDIQQMQDAMSARGVKFEDKPHLIARMTGYDLWMTHFRDCENNLFSLMSEVPNKK
jgi:predicted enzyme related to lactoylglutathione lyase